MSAETDYSPKLGAVVGMVASLLTISDDGYYEVFAKLVLGALLGSSIALALGLAARFLRR